MSPEYSALTAGRDRQNKSTSKIWCCKQEYTYYLISILQINRNQMLSLNFVYNMTGNQARDSASSCFSTKAAWSPREMGAGSLLMCRKNSLAREWLPDGGMGATLSCFLTCTAEYFFLSSAAFASLHHHILLNFTVVIGSTQRINKLSGLAHCKV